MVSFAAEESVPALVREVLEALRGERERLMETVPRVGEYYRARDTRRAS
ncbi:hypothetical protein [Nocardiopsis chromatogenes]|nr:hypothetical protein [Nocardiopsis chromatogenes]